MIDAQLARESNISNNHSNLMSHDYSYSPDFRDPSVAYQDSAADVFSPPYQNSRMIQKPSDEDAFRHKGILRYEEFEGECYTNNSSQGGVFFSGGTHNGS